MHGQSMFIKIKSLMRSYVNLPLHPQWLILRKESRLRWEIAQLLEGRTLDIGSGSGQIAHLISSKIHYVSLDYPATHAKGYTGVPHIFGDGHHLPFCNESFNSIILLDVLEHLSFPEQCLQETARVLCKGGKLILKVPFLYPLHDMPHDFQRWTLPGLEMLVQRNHFTITDQRFFGNPSETVAALSAIALAKAILDILERKLPTIILLPLFIAAIIFINLSGWVLGRILPPNDFMPLGYLLVCTKK